MDGIQVNFITRHTVGEHQRNALVRRQHCLAGVLIPEKLGVGIEKIVGSILEAYQL